MEGPVGVLSLGIVTVLVVFGGTCDLINPSEPIEVSDNEVLAFGLRDPVGDADVGFVDLTNVTIYVHEQTIKVRLKVRELPEELLYNRRGLPVGHIEYLWQVFFDLNAEVSFEGDVILTLANTIEPWVEPDRAPLVDFALPEMWICDSTGTDPSFCCTPRVSTIGNSIFLEVSKVRYPKLDALDSNVSVQVLAYHNDGRTEYSDWMPDVVGSTLAVGRPPAVAPRISRP